MIMDETARTDSVQSIDSESHTQLSRLILEYLSELGVALLHLDSVTHVVDNLKAKEKDA